MHAASGVARGWAAAGELQGAQAMSQSNAREQAGQVRGKMANGEVSLWRKSVGVRGQSGGCVIMIMQRRPRWRCCRCRRC